jgi:hypothetical protein
VYVYIYMYVCMCVCMQVCMHVCICVCMYVRIHIYIYVCMCVCMYVWYIYHIYICMPAVGMHVMCLGLCVTLSVCTFGFMCIIARAVSANTGTHLLLYPPTQGTLLGSVYVYYRKGCICEHWDTLAPLPSDTRNTAR